MKISLLPYFGFLLLLMLIASCAQDDPYALQMPDENRFVREVLTYNLNEPMELEYLPNGNILLIERAGDIKVFDQKSGSIITAAHLEVERVAEDGLLGLAIDPEYAKNHWIYLFHSPNNGTKNQRLSRFNFENNVLDLTSEKILLEFASTRECCHSGGSLEFDGAGNLYLSTGDNTNPFESDGYSPSDETPGRSVWDAQKSSANSNDLRGKILRIKPEPDGTYSIPEGNLFEDDDPLTRPEIYVMGLRNAFRANVDKKTGILYWGDVGPDAGEDHPTRGPKGHDELNQAKAAGNWGWPYTRGNNKPYYDYDFENKVSRGLFDPNNLVNNSPNNTGIQNLPPAQPSFIWYPYDASTEFPWVGTGGRNAMAGPVFHAEDYTHLQNKFPQYFDNKLFIFDWIRDWIFLITLDQNQDFVQAERFMPNSIFHNPIDMLFGQDGNLYVLEYGESWNTKNLDAQLNKISFVAGNRAPIAKITGDQTVGGLPLTVNFSAESSLDLEGDPLIYRWDFGDGNTAEGINVSHQFTQAGNYQVTMTVSDDKGLSSSTSYQIVAGNEAPVIRVSFTSENTFYTRKTPLEYSVKVTDREDGEVGQGIDARQVSVSLDFLPEGMDRIVAKPGHQVAIEYLGKEYIALSDCAACHAIDHKVNGPSYKQIANKYAAADLAYLQEKIRNGGNGVWGETAMVAHPQLTEKETSEIVKYILSLADDYEVLPVSGQLRFTQHDPQNLQGAYLLTATYTDRGGEGVEPITTQEQIIMKAAMLEGEKADEKDKEISTLNVDGNTLIRNLKDGKYIRYDDVLFDHLSEISLRLYYDAKNAFAGMIEVRRGSSDGLLLGSVTTSHPLAKNNKRWDNQSVRLKESAGRDKLYLVFRNTASPDTPVANLDYLVLGYQD